MTALEHLQRSTALAATLTLTPNAEVLGALNAMNRAAKNARQLALQTGTNLILVRNGQVVAVSPHDVADPV